MTEQPTSCDDCRLWREADHRIANHLAMLAAFVRLKEIEVDRESVTPEAVHLLLETIRTQTDAVASLHRMLSAQGANATADLAHHLQATCTPLAALLAGRVEIGVECAADCRVTPDKVLPVTQIVSEAVTNAVKYAYRDGGAGRIQVLGRQDGASMVVEIADEGPGLRDGLDPRSGGGLGLRLMRALSKQLGGELEFISKRSGLVVRLTFPAGPTRGGGQSPDHSVTAGV
ncbi:two-component sensor histidine kinase [Phenylobacterium haematophilum]|uniref:histidine kinase n=1 Tax=Phenylobacterium haematophilum TaxID=98513 RepID=A0A839ZTN3_9CAUL|nr:sensor histidine kinase [Phenylobacterium haematophilum]MBB3889344.1 two-component sensor histidine kinase [Phenylobacterium haematophilum]